MKHIKTLLLIFTISASPKSFSSDIINTSAQAYFYTHLVGSDDCKTFAKIDDKKFKQEISYQLELWHFKYENESLKQHKSRVCSKYKDDPICKIVLPKTSYRESQTDLYQRAVNEIYSPLLRHITEETAIENLISRGVRRDKDMYFKMSISDLERKEITRETFYDSLELRLALLTRLYVKVKGMWMAQSLSANYEGNSASFRPDNKDMSLSDFMVEEKEWMQEMKKGCSEGARDMHRRLNKTAVATLKSLTRVLKMTKEEVIEDFCKDKKRKTLCEDQPYIHEEKKSRL